MTVQNSTTLSARFIGALSRYQWVWGLGVWAPLSAILLGLKGTRLRGVEHDLDLLATVELFRSELFVVVGLAALGFGLFARFRKSPWLWAAAAVYQATAAFFGITNVVAHQFYVSTGTSLDWSLFAFGLSHLDNVSDVVMSEVSAISAALLVAVVLYFVAGPPTLAVAWRKWLQRESEVPPCEAASHHWLALGTASIAFLVALLPVNSMQLSSGFAREATLHLAVTAFDKQAPRSEGPSQAIFDTSAARLEPTEQTRPKNVVFIVLESTRAEATTVYSPSLASTPYLAELADESLVLQNAYAVLPHTSKALVAILCGIPPQPTMPIVEAVPGNIPGKCLAELLAEHGYQSAFFQNATGNFENRDKLVAKMGFDEFYPLEEMETDGFEKVNYFGYEEAVMMPVSKRWLQTRDKPFVATYLTLSPHHDYLAPKRYGRKDFAAEDTFNRYLNSVHYLDHFVRALIDQYKELGLYESTLFVIVGDHGEAFGEHGRFQHDNVIYQEGVRVPWIIHDPLSKVVQGRVTTRVNHLDILPTVAGLLGYDIRQARFPGSSVFGVSADRPQFFSCWYEERCIGMLHGPFKYIHHYGDQPDELFDLRTDPKEQENVARVHPELVERRRQIVLTWKKLVEDVYADNVSNTISDKVRTSRPEVPVAREVRFGEHVKLLGYDLSAREVTPGMTLDVTLFYEVLQDLGPKAAAAFLATAGEDRFPIAHFPLNDEHPMSQWSKGQFIVDHWQLTVPQDWKGEWYALEVIMGDRGGRAWRYQGADGTSQKALEVFRLPVN